MIGFLVVIYISMSIYVFCNTINRGILKFKSNRLYNTKQDFFKILFEFNPHEVFDFDPNSDGYFWSAILFALFSPLSFPYLLIQHLAGILFTFIKK